MPAPIELRRPVASRGVIALSALLVLGGCGGATGPDAELRAARARWERSQPAAYAYTLSRSCECLPEMAGPVRIDVRNGAVTSRVYVATGATVDPKWADLFPTIDGLFVMIDGASERGETVEASYDAHYGYPHRIAIDREHWEVDGGANIVVDDFRPR